MEWYAVVAKCEPFAFGKTQVAGSVSIVQIGTKGVCDEFYLRQVKKQQQLERRIKAGRARRTLRSAVLLETCFTVKQIQVTIAT